MPPRYDPIHDILIDEAEPSDQPAKEESIEENPEQPPTESTSDENVKEEQNDVKTNEFDTDVEMKNEDTEPETETAPPPPSLQPQEDNNTSEQKTEETTDTTNPKKHKLSPSPSKVHLKKTKKPGNKSATVLSSARSRHLKKDDGKPFLRKDIQYQFLKDLFDNKTRAFRDPYADSKDKVNTEPEDSTGHKLTFAELYIKTIAHSSKCSKILRDRLLNDMKMSIPTSMICLLVNVGRMNTTINFVPDMKSQLRTYHSIPCLQVDYDASENKFTTSGNGGDKQLQDTPRLKSILKACCDDTEEPNALALLESVEKLPKTSVINVIFLLCNAEESINKKYLNGAGYTFFDIFMNADYDPDKRALLFLWLVYAYLETNLTDAEIAENPFGHGAPPALTKTDKEQDIDTPEEIEFGENLYHQRVNFLAEDEADPKREEKVEKKKTSETSTASTEPLPKPLLMNTSKTTSDSTTKTPIKKSEKATPIQKSNTPASKQSIAKAHQAQTPSSYSPVPPFTLPQLPKNDIDTDKVKKSLKYLARIFGKKRDKMGQVRYEHNRIVLEEQLAKEKEEEEINGPAPTNNRMRLKNYKGDYVENSDKFYKLFNLLKNDFVEMTKADEEHDVSVNVEYEDTSKDLTLKSFSLDF